MSVVTSMVLQNKLKYDFKLHWEMSFFSFTAYRLYIPPSFNLSVKIVTNLFINVVNIITSWA